MRGRKLPFVVVALFLGSAGLAQQPTCKPSVAPQPKAKAGVTQPATSQRPAARQPFQVVATVKDIMDGMVDPAADFIFDSVATEITASGIVERAPKNDEEWTKVRHNALIVMEGANLLMMEGRRVAPEKETLAAGNPKGVQIELTPMQIEAKIAKDRKTFVKLAAALSSAASLSLKAAQARDAQALLNAGDNLDTACENCHLRYWYPSQVEILAKAAKALK